MSVYYNEHDSFAAAWLRELIRAGLIAEGEVDERSIVDVQPDDLRGYQQCHFFAGIGGWSYALRLAGWPDDRPVWTGSCPCQPFSQAGRGKAEADARHLWPEFRRLIAECRPPVVFGEQVASKAGRRWLAGVFADVEALAYRRAGADLCAASAGAPHIRQRLWWVADTAPEQRYRSGIVGPRWWFEPPDGCAVCDCGHTADQHRTWTEECLECSCTFWLANLLLPGREGLSLQLQPGPAREAGDQAGESGASSRLGESEPTRLQGLGGRAGALREPARAHAGQAAGRAGDQSFWSAYDLLPCRDGVSRRVEPGTFPLAHGAPARVGRLRGYGNAIVPQVAAAFIEAYCEAVGVENHHD